MIMSSSPQEHVPGRGRSFLWRRRVQHGLFIMVAILGVWVAPHAGLAPWMERVVVGVLVAEGALMVGVVCLFERLAYQWRSRTGEEIPDPAERRRQREAQGADARGADARGAATGGPAEDRDDDWGA